MKRFKEKLKNICKNKVFVSILLLTLCIFPLLSGLNGSKTGDIKANALSAPTTKTLDLNGVRYEYKTSLNELKNKYGLFVNKANSNIFTFVNNSEGETYIRYTDLRNLTDEKKMNVADETKNIFKFYYRNQDNAFNYETLVDNSFDDAATNIELSNIDNLSNIDKITINFNEFGKLPFNYILNTQCNIFFYYIPDDVNFTINNYEDIQKNCIIQGYSLSRAINFTFDLPVYPGYIIQNIICSISVPEDYENEFEITTEQFSTIIDSSSLIEYTESLTTISGLSFIENQYANVITYFAKSTDNTSYPVFQGNILLSTTKYDKELFSYLIGNISAQTVIQPLGRGYFGGYNPEKNPQANIYFKYLNSGIQSGVRYVASFDNISYNSPFYSLFTGVPVGTEIWKYNNQNQLLYLQDITDLKINSSVYTGAGLSAQVDNILYNVTLVGNEQQIQKNENIQEDFINLLKTSALGTFIGLLIGIISGNPALGAVIGGVSGLLGSIIPLAIDALEGFLGSSPALTTIYNLFKSITMLFVDIFDAIINFALSFITNPIVLILVVVGILIYIFVIRKFKK